MRNIGNDQIAYSWAMKQLSSAVSVNAIGTINKKIKVQSQYHQMIIYKRENKN